MLIIAASMAGCGGGIGTGGGSASQARPSQSAHFICTLVIGFSQTRTWFMAMEAGGHVDGDRWELLWHGGAGVNAWADADSRYWNEPIASPCTARSRDPDRIVLTITGNTSTPWEQRIAQALDNVRRHFPSVRDIRLQPVVGGPNHEVCVRPSRTGGEQVVRATDNHPAIDEAIAMLVGGDVNVGADPLVAACSDFRDALGHLTPDANERQARTIAEYYGGG